ncbi:hypothetical protein [Caproicibacterium sp. XB1]|uniref:hypothetical protein n=1 Tax=Caproicibacterium sp. XB1 TaxID=3396405 RepID=UPI0039B6F459
MKNEYAAKLQAKQMRRDSDNVKRGFDFAMMIATVALNEKFGFGATRLKALETECNRLMDEEFGRDMESASHQLIGRLKQIMGGTE